MDSCERLAQKYDVAGPRYTSYPTAMQFSEQVNAEVFTEKVKQQQTTAPLSLYIHLPFCADICYYCACNKKVTRDRGEIDRYLAYLYREMGLVRQQLGLSNRAVSQLHWGGGTPTYLDPAEMTELMLVTARHFNLTTDKQRDYSVEIDPRTVTRETIELLRGLGFNRASLGVQDFSLPVQQAINRIQPLAMVEEVVGVIRERAFGSLNFDMIYGLPAQSLDSLAQTLDQVIRLRPERINYYNYAHLPERFPSQRAIDRLQLPSAEHKIAMLDLIKQRLTAAGYLHLGMDNFVLADDTLAKAFSDGNLIRNFQGYSIAKAPDLLGLGASSISQFDGVYAQNHTDIALYQQAIDSGSLPTARGCLVSEDDRRRGWVIQRLMCQRALSFSAWEAEFGGRFWEYFQASLGLLLTACGEGIVQLTEDGLRVPAAGEPYLRNIAMMFDQYLLPAAAVKTPSGRPHYSKTL